MLDLPPLWLDSSFLEFIIISALSVALLCVIKLIFKWIYKNKDK